MAMQEIVVQEELQKHLLTIDFLDRNQVLKFSNRTKVADLELAKYKILLVQVSWCDLTLIFRHLSLYLGKKRCRK